MHRSSIRLSLFLPLLTLFFIACENGIDASSELSTVTYDLSNFSGISADNGCQVTIVADSVWSVEVTTNEDYVQKLDIAKHGDGLVLRLDPNTSYAGNKVFRATVHMPLLRTLELRSGSSADLGSGFRSTVPFACALIAGSSVRGNIETGNLSAALSGGSNLVLTGRGDKGAILASMGSQANLGQFTLNSGSVAASEGSSITVNMLGALNVDGTGGSTVYYRGLPVPFTVRLRDGSTARPIP